jgi:general stress protein 26
MAATVTSFTNVLPPATPEERTERLEKLRDLIEKIPICMVTTTGADGSVHSRPMAYLRMEPDGELLFFTRAASTKAIEVRRNRQVNLSFCDPTHNLYVSISGRARITNDHEKSAELFTPIMKQWFPEGAGDPSLRLFSVDPHFAEYWDGPSGLGFLLAVARSMLTGNKADFGDHDFFEF